MTTRWLTFGNRRVRPSALDAAFSILGVLFVIGTHFRTDPNDSFAIDLAFGLLGGGVVLFRRQWPIPVLLVSFALLVVSLISGQSTLAHLIFPEFALFTVAVQTDRRTTVIAGATAAVSMYLAILLHSGIGWDQGASVGILAWTGLFAAAGDATRNRRSYIEAIEERARKAESERDAEAARQVAEERLRIARELHDVLAHHIAVIHVHAGLADATMSTAPATSKESLGHIRQAAAEVLTELSALIPVLRSDDEGVGAPAAPAPGLERLDDLLDSYRRSGAPVRLNVSGKPQQLPSASDLAAYRIIQEALTNAGKHGVPGTAELGLDYRDGRVGIRVVNRVAESSTAPGTGHGLVGMRERAASVGAEITTRRQQNLFVVEVELEVGAAVR